jgi:hypothetical protein
MGKRAEEARKARRLLLESKAKEKASERAPNPMAEAKVQQTLIESSKKKDLLKLERSQYRSKNARASRTAERARLEAQRRDFVQDLRAQGLPHWLFNLSSALDIQQIKALLSGARILDEDNSSDYRVLRRFEKEQPYYLRNVEPYAVLEFAPPVGWHQRPGVVTQLWHGTGMQGTLGITKQGFQIPRWGGGMMGPAVYTAPQARKALNYVRVTGGFGWLFLADVKLGTVVKTNQFGAGNVVLEEVKRQGGDTGFAEKGDYRGAWRGAIQESEYATYDENRVYARYLFILKYQQGYKGW